MVDAMTGYDSKRNAAADKDALFEKFEVAQPAQEPDMQTGIAYQKGFHDGKQAALAQPAQPAEEWPGQSNIESLHNACQHRGYCKQLKAQPPLPVQPAQEPVAQWLEDAFREGWESYRDSEFASKITENWAFGNSIANGRMIDLQQNTTSPQRPWVGLTDAEVRTTIDSIGQYVGSYEEIIARKIETKLKQLNT
jgi:hypothetical protein